MLRTIFSLCLLLAAGYATAQAGCRKGNCYDGHGTYRLADGATYEGDFRKGKFSGLGILTYPDNSRYVGNFRDGLQEGKGRLIDAVGNNFFGLWHRGMRHGQGEMILVGGNKIAGNWTNDRLDGEISFHFANDDFYQGDMVNDIITGTGTMQYANGDLYTGAWSNNQRHGEGKMIFADGTELDGKWESGNFQTNWAVLGFQGSTASVADCFSGCPDGYGRYTYSDGSTFLGQVVGGMPSGQGTVNYPNGNAYHGAFHQHRPNGLGVHYSANGKIEGGLWKDGQLYRKLYSAEGQPVAKTTTAYDPTVKIWAVVVGCAYYQHMRTLRYTDDDAYQVYSFLRSIEGGALPDNQVRILVDEDATQAHILTAMRDTYRQADENDVILFYFSGHGLPGAFLPVDYDGRSNALRHEDIHDALLSSRSRHKLVIADACHSGSLGGRAAKTGSGGVGDALDAYYTALNNAQASTALLMSSKGQEISLEDGGLRSGVFSHYLIRGMKGEADSNNDSLVSIQELFAFVHREVRSYTGNIQTPTLTGVYDELMPVSVIRGR